MLLYSHKNRSAIIVMMKGVDVYEEESERKRSIFIIAAVCIGMIWFFSILEQNAQPGISRVENAAESAAVTEVTGNPSADNGSAYSNDYADQEGKENLIDDYEYQVAEKDSEVKTEEIKKKSGGRLFYGGKNTGKGSSSGSYKPKGSTSATTEFDSDDHDIDSYYEDNKDEFDSIDDAYDSFEDDEDAWDDY